MDSLCYDFMREELENYLENTDNMQMLCKSIRAVYYKSRLYWKFNEKTSEKYMKSFTNTQLYNIIADPQYFDPFYKLVNKRIDTKLKLCLIIKSMYYLPQLSQYRYMNVHMIIYNNKRQTMICLIEKEIKLNRRFLI